MRKRILCLILLSMFCGCMQPKSIDSYAYVLNIGVEKGTTMPYLVTFLVSVPGDGTETTKVENRVLTAEARTLTEAASTLNSAYPSRLSFSRASLLVIHEDLAITGGQTDFLDFAFGKADLWQNVRVIIVRDHAKDMFEGWLSESDPSLRKIKTAAAELAIRSGLTADVGYSAFSEAVECRYQDAMIAYAGVNRYGLQPDLIADGTYPYTGGSLLVESILSATLAGCAVFDGDRMVGVLDGQHTMDVMMVTDDFVRGEKLYTLPDGQTLSVTLSRARRPKIRLLGNAVDVELYLNADPTSPQSVPMDSDTLKIFLKTKLEAELSAVFQALQSVNSDAMGFGRAAARRMRTVEAWEAYDWKSVYRTLSVTFTVHIMLSHSPTDAISE